MSITHDLQLVRNLLRKQGPLSYYVQRNPLEGFQQFPFFEGIQRASNLYRVHVLPKASWYPQKAQAQVTNKIIDIEKIYWPISTYWDVFNEANYVEGKYKWDIHKYKFFSAYFDKGQAYWPMMERHHGPLHCFAEYLKNDNSPYLAFLPNILEIHNLDLAIEFLLEKLLVPKEMYPNFLFFVLHKMKGWSAYVLDLEDFPEHNSNTLIVDFKEYTLINLIIEYSLFLELVAQKKIPAQFKYKLIPPDNIHQLELPIQQQIEYENSLLSEVINALKNNTPKEMNNTPAIQLVTCIDDREEGVHRHFQNLGENGAHQSFSYAGHFGIPIMFKGLYKGFIEAFYKPQCPLLVKPKYYVTEKKAFEQDHSFYDHLCDYYNHYSKWLFQYTKMPLVDTILSFLIGPIIFIPFLLNVLFPRLALKIKIKISRPYKTILEHKIPLEDKAQFVFNMLNTIGLKSNFAPFLLICGHGSIHINNPHKSSYNCGACRGSKGNANARLMCEFGNDPNVRQILLTKFKVIIPETTRFVPMMHDTCNDDFHFYDFQSDHLTKLFNEISQLNALERSRNFKETPFPWDGEKALLHVQMRALSLMNPRAEYNRAGKSIAFIGTRSLTQGINFDRRSFLLSYKHSNDPQGDILHGLLSAVVPVLSSINLDYFFSATNNKFFGCGVKQPHNITSYLGVMNGYKSDLLLGLQQQAIELHRPMRLMLFIETTKDQFEKTLPRCSQNIMDIINNEWVRVFICESHQSIFQYTKNVDMTITWKDISDMPLTLYPHVQNFSPKERDVLPIQGASSK